MADGALSTAGWARGLLHLKAGSPPPVRRHLPHPWGRSTGAVPQGPVPLHPRRATQKKSVLTVCFGRGTLAGCAHRHRPASRRRSAPARCGRGCWRRPSSAWSSAAGPARRPRWSPSGPGSAAAPSCTTSRPRTPWSLAAVEHLTERRGAELRRGGRRPAAPARGAPGPVLDMLGDHFTGPVFAAALELWVAARTDADAAARRRPAGAAGRPRDAPAHRRRCSASTSRRPGVRELVQATLDLVRGLGLANTSPTTPPAAPPPRPPGRRSPPCSTPDAPADRPTQRPEAPGRPRPTCSPTSPPRATSSRPWSPACRRGRLAHADPGRRAGTSRTSRPPRLDRRGGACSPPPTRTALGRARCSRRSPTRRGFVDARRSRRSAARAGRAARPLARRPDRRWPTRWPRSRPGEKLPWFGPPMSRHLDGHRPVHGDLGARPRRRRRARRQPRRRPTGSGTSRTSACAPAGFAFATHGLRRRRPSVPGRADRARRRRVVAGARRTPPTGSPARRATSACWSPSAATAPTPTWSPPARTPTGGSTSRRRSPARRARAGAGGAT